MDGLSSYGKTKQMSTPRTASAFKKILSWHFAPPDADSTAMPRGRIRRLGQLFDPRRNDRPS
jgi:hypothetical protein